MRRLHLPIICLAAALFSACADRIVTRDPLEPLNLPIGAGGFLGYHNPAAKLTVCGNCHITQNSQWAQTTHANAYAAAVQLAPQAAEVCAVCHAVSPFGNNATQPGGWPATREARYHDVQCESCHGPGLDHVRNPDGGTVASVLARVDAGVQMNATCTECHGGFHHPFVQEWAESGHGRVITAAAGRADCEGCHEGKAALRALGVLSRYQEEGSAAPIAITCAVCHDPHRTRFDKQLRYSIDMPDEQQNLCMRCHHKRGGPDFTAQNRGPHSPEGPMLLGEAGWWPPNMPVQPGTQIVGTHGSEANPRMCAGCHMQRFEVEDRQTQQFSFETTSHMFEAIPCIDAQGRPTRLDNCTVQQRTFRTCTAAGCHPSQAAARNAMLTVRARVDNWNNQLKSQLARVPAAEFNPNDNRYSTGEGARFNSQLADRPGSVTHNPFLIEALLIGSIQQVQRDYGINPSTPGAELESWLRAALTRSTKLSAAD
jgi:predicted CXXCH cytochrome family protein